MPPLSPPVWVAVILQVPPATRWTLPLTIVQTAGVVDWYVTGNVEEDVAPGSKSASVLDFSLIGAKVMLCLALTVNELMTSVAAA